MPYLTDTCEAPYGADEAERRQPSRFVYEQDTFHRAVWAVMSRLSGFGSGVALGVDIVDDFFYAHMFFCCVVEYKGEAREVAEPDFL